jgi:hypothetical protein
MVVVEGMMIEDVEEARMRAVAENFCRESLAIMDGSAEAGIRRIGTERFDQLVDTEYEILASITGKKANNRRR